ncbi:serine/threonine protein kinase [Pendulispora albinea]|uniref:Serine/threonine protein kinase n=1 Tax=Pendulispora albinea TaxID=2741071 RepID=A0ABZ2LW90_9BACT
MAEEVSPITTPVEMPKEGEIIAGKFRVERVLAVGGMGMVFAAQHMIMGQRVAVKMLLPDALIVPSAIERFHREAQAAANIRNEHVVRIMDVGHTETGAPYIVMEYLVGSDLGELIERRKNIPIQEAVDYVLQTCEAMADAHRIGIVHRDLKPGNVFLTRRSDGTPLIKVLDFGISKLGEEMMGQKQWQLTRTHVMMGSPLYMSPEQIRNAKTVDRRSDIWSLGIILFELLTGQLPFEGETAIAICAQVAADPPIPLRLLHPEMPEELEDIILRCLEKEPEQRFDDVAALAEALAPFASEAGRASAVRVRRTLSDASQMPTLNAARIKVDPPRKATPRPLAKTDASWQKKAMREAGLPPKRRGRTFLGLVFVGALGFGAWAMRDQLMSVTKDNLLPDPDSLGKAAASSEKMVKDLMATAAIPDGDAAPGTRVDSVPSTSSAAVDASTASAIAPNATPSSTAVDAGAGSADAGALDAGDDDEEEDDATPTPAARGPAGGGTGATPARTGTAPRKPVGHPAGKPKKKGVRHK